MRMYAIIEHPYPLTRPPHPRFWPAMPTAGQAGRGIGKRMCSFVFILTGHETVREGVIAQIIYACDIHVCVCHTYTCRCIPAPSICSRIRTRYMRVRCARGYVRTYKCACAHLRMAGGSGRVGPAIKRASSIWICRKAFSRLYTTYICKGERYYTARCKYSYCL